MPILFFFLIFFIDISMTPLMFLLQRISLETGRKSFEIVER